MIRRRYLLFILHIIHNILDTSCLTRLCGNSDFPPYGYRTIVARLGKFSFPMAIIGENLENYQNYGVQKIICIKWGPFILCTPFAAGFASILVMRFPFFSQKMNSHHQMWFFLKPNNFHLLRSRNQLVGKWRILIILLEPMDF